MKLDFAAFLSAWLIGPILLLIFAGVVNLLFAFLGMWCWNQFCDTLHLGHLSYWQAWSMLMFCVLIAGIFHSKSNIS